LRRADHSFKESYCLCKKDYGTEEEAGAQQRVVGPLMNEKKKKISYSQHLIIFSDTEI
jgi:hypothetical protein